MASYHAASPKTIHISRDAIQPRMTAWLEGEGLTGRSEATPRRLSLFPTPEWERPRPAAWQPPVPQSPRPTPRP
ncbi:MAG: hypothetical protein AMXMBFR80_28840 [Dehalococcoidia bacterium]